MLARVERKEAFKRCLRLSLAAILAFMPGLPLLASDANEEDLKTLLVYKVAKFVRWPDEQRSTPFLELCVLGSLDSMKKLNDKPLGGQPIRVQSIRSPAEALALKCQIVFLRRGSGYEVSEVAIELADSPVLLISDESRAAERGFMVEIARDGNRLGLRVNPTTARESGLGLASSLIRLASVVG